MLTKLLIIIAPISLVCHLWGC